MSGRAHVDSTQTYISLYAGGGGLDMGFKRANPDARCIAVVEHEASAAALLVDHVEAQLLDAAPLWTDAFTFPAERFHGLVDWIIGGPPCQPFSVAGKRLGADDPRNLWPLTLRLVQQIQPRGCFFENVGSAESLWYCYEEVIPGLRYLGYEVEAGIFSAAEVGAPHQRQRIFILGHSGHSTRSPKQRQQHEVTASVTRRTGGELADSGRGSDQRWRKPGIVERQEQAQPGEARQQRHGNSAGDEGADVADAISERGCSGNVEGQDAIHAFPPGPTDDWSNIPERLWPATKPDVRSVVDGLAPGLVELSRAQRLRIAGNGVVPQTAEKAFATLMEKFAGERVEHG